MKEFWHKKSLWSDVFQGQIWLQESYPLVPLIFSTALAKPMANFHSHQRFIALFRANTAAFNLCLLVHPVHWPFRRWSMALLVSTLAPSGPVRKLHSACNQRQTEWRWKPTGGQQLLQCGIKRHYFTPNLCATQSESRNICHHQWEDKPESMRCIKEGVRAVNLQTEEKLWDKYSGTNAQMTRRSTLLYQLHFMSLNPEMQNVGLWSWWSKTLDWSIKWQGSLRKSEIYLGRRGRDKSLYFLFWQT